MLHDNKDVRFEIRLSEKEKSDFFEAVKLNNDKPSSVIRGLIVYYTLQTLKKNENK